MSHRRPTIRRERAAAVTAIRRERAFLRYMERVASTR
jgi:hypothetical protein